jgi:hypothetical protein
MKFFPLLLAFALVGCGSSTSRYASVVADIEHGILAAPTNGILRLPARFSAVAPRAEVYVEKKLDGRLLVLFPPWYGRGADMEGFLYCSGALARSDFYCIDWGAGGVHEHLDVGGRDILTVKDLKPHWYRVTRRLD